MALRTLPNIEALIVGFLRADPDVAALLGPRVYAGALGSQVRPCARVTRYGGAPAIQRPLELDRADLQVDVWATKHAQAHDIAATLRAVLAERLPGAHTDGRVGRVEFGQFSHDPDPTFDPPAPRVIFDVSVWYRPA